LQLADSLNRRFPIISGFRVEWDSRKPPGQRVLGIWLTDEADNDVGQEGHSLKDCEPIKNEKGGRKYKVVTREYMAGGFDGFTALKGSRYLVDDENGMMMSTIIRRFLLGLSLPASMQMTLDTETEVI
jgi:5'-nucleotidase